MRASRARGGGYGLGRRRWWSNWVGCGWRGYVGIVIAVMSFASMWHFGKIPRLIFNKIMSMAYFCARRDGRNLYGLNAVLLTVCKKPERWFFICVSPQSTTPASVRPVQFMASQKLLCRAVHVQESR
jgi:hypothetical protein